MSSMAGHSHAPARAALLLMIAMLLFAAQDVALKWLTSGYGVPQVIFFGRFLAVPLALVLAWRNGGLGQLMSRRPGGHLLRIGFTAGDMLMFTTSISMMPLADTVTIGFAAPLIMTVLSILFLREKVGIRRWSAVGIGFVGVLIVMQPSGAGYGLGAMLALGSAASFAMVLILTRALTNTDSIPCMIFWNSMGMAILMGVLMVPDWRTPTGDDIWIFAVNALTGAIGQLLLTESFRHGEVSFLAPIQYTSLLWAAIFGFLFFADVPTPTLLLGAGIIIGSALYIIEREARLGRSRSRQP
jgi:drug/metabolite transporter (DMT)-like permease